MSDALASPSLKIGLFLFTLLVYAASSLFIADKVPISGDEPHYLLMAHSLVHDGDLNLRNNYEQADYAQFYHLPNIDPHAYPYTNDEAWYAIHNAGLPLLLAPAYALGGKTAVILTMSLLAALLSVNLFALSNEYTGHGRAALLAGALLSFTIPLLPWASQIYTEIPVALVLVWGLRLLGKFANGRFRDNHLSQSLAWLSLGLCIAVLPWLHTKYALASLALTALALWQLWQQQALVSRRSLALLVPPIIAGLLFLFFFNRWYSSPWPGAPYQNGQWLNLRGAGIAFLGWFLDQEFGVLPYAPVYLLAILGIPLAARRHGRTFWTISIVTGLAFAPNLLLAVPGWWGGATFPARFLLPALPFFAVTLASFLADAWHKRAAQIITGLLVLLSLSITLFFVRDPLLLRNGADGVNNMIGRITPGTRDPSTYLPSFVPAAQPGYTWRQEAEWLFAKTGIVVSDGEASGGTSKFSAGQAGLLASGPRQALRAGYYQAQIWLKAEGPVTAPAAAIRVLAVELTQEPNPARTLLAADTIRVEDVNRSYAPVSINFNYPGKSELTIEILAQPGVDLWADRLTFTRLSHQSGPATAVFPPNSVSYTLGEQIHLTGYALHDQRLIPGQSLAFSLYWRADSIPTQDYTVFTHLVGEDGRIWSQQDNYPVQGARTTTGWLPQETIVDWYRLALPPNLPAGEYRLRVGMYNWRTGENLQATSPEGSGDHIILTTLSSP